MQPSDPFAHPLNPWPPAARPLVLFQGNDGGPPSPGIEGCFSIALDARMFFKDGSNPVSENSLAFPMDNPHLEDVAVNTLGKVILEQSGQFLRREGIQWVQG